MVRQIQVKKDGHILTSSFFGGSNNVTDNALPIEFSIEELEGIRERL